MNPVGMWASPGAFVTVGLSGHKNRENYAVMAGAVEILEVQRIVPRLVDGVAVELLFADLELDGKDHSVRQNDGVHPAAKAWNVELKKDMALVAPERILQDLDGLRPSARLRRVNREKPAGLGELSDQCIDRFREEIADTAAVLGGETGCSVPRGHDRS